MEQLDPPDPVTWDERRLWFEAQESTRAAAGTQALSEQACALLIDLQACFCAGAWAAVVILAAGIIESQLDALKGPRGAPLAELRWLRALRNRLVHENPGDPVLTIEDQWAERPLWEAHARRAVCLVFQVMYPERSGSG